MDWRKRQDANGCGSVRTYELVNGTINIDRNGKSLEKAGMRLHALSKRKNGERNEEGGKMLNERRLEIINGVPTGQSLITTKPQENKRELYTYATVCMV